MTTRTIRIVDHDPAWPARFAELGGRLLAARFPHDGHAYTDAKAAIVWEIIHRADDWAQAIGWEAGPSDA